MRNVLVYSILAYFVFAQSCGAVKLSSAENDVDPQEILQQLLPEIPGLIIVPPKELEPNPPVFIIAIVSLKETSTKMGGRMLQSLL